MVLTIPSAWPLLPAISSSISAARTAFLFAAALLAAACSSTTPYPAGWERPMETVACPTLGGVFENFGEWVVDEDHDQRMLAGVFFASDALETGAVTHVSFDPGAGAVLATAWVGPEPLYQRSLSASELGCEGGALIVRDAGWVAEGQIGAAARVRSVYALRLTDNGELVMSQHDSWAGLIVVVPIAGKATTWLRFRPVDPDRPPDPRWPRGVREKPAIVEGLRPPQRAPKWSAYEQAKLCLARARANSDMPLDPGQLGSLDGHATQTFVLGRNDGAPWPAGKTDRDKGWMPAQHSYRVAKLNWELPAVADHYVLCLLEEGYRWE
ncbi:MAG TPA: hypothetical protein VLA15_00710 [Desulfurivibrionaceae bacterium]|nr:hypothetical protein [Desulfurivibrionaceae bacterium]